MILDLAKFIRDEQPYWDELERRLVTLESHARARLDLAELEQLHYLYERAASDLARLSTFSAEVEWRRYLEQLVARAYGEIHADTESSRHFSLWRWLTQTLPGTFRAHARAFCLAAAVTLAGVCFGAVATVVDPDSRSVTMPFGHDKLDPIKRVLAEETGNTDAWGRSHAAFSAMLMTHNTRVAMLTMALGVTWGVGTVLMLFRNGIALGAIGIDYGLAGQTKFLLGWLLPHGVIEIPAILIAAQAGFVLAHAMLGYGDRRHLRARLRAVAGDVVTLMFGAALLLVWAGFVEGFFSQYHEPTVPYTVKIGFGLAELGLLVTYLTRAGRTRLGARVAISRRSRP